MAMARSVMMKVVAVIVVEIHGVYSDIGGHYWKIIGCSVVAAEVVAHICSQVSHSRHGCSSMLNC